LLECFIEVNKLEIQIEEAETVAAEGVQAD